MSGDREAPDPAARAVILAHARFIWNVMLASGDVRPPPDAPFYLCDTCGWRSYLPKDTPRYCVRCHKFGPA